MSAVVREIECRSALVKSGIPGVDFVLNPYTGCAHGCVYCYAQFMTRFRPHAEPWGGFVDVKVNFAGVLDRECRRLFRRLLPGTGDPADEPPEIMLSSVTDAYQPAEREYRIARDSLRVIAEHLEDEPSAGGRVPLVSILTKSDLVVRDADLLRALPRSEVGFTITTPDDRMAGMLEPGAPVTSRRFKAIETLSAKGISTWVFIAPAIPGRSDQPAGMRRLFGMAEAAGAKRILVDRVNLYPSCLGGLMRLFRGDEAALARLGYARTRPDEYESELRAVLDDAAQTVSIDVEAVF